MSLNRLPPIQTLHRIDPGAGANSTRATSAKGCAARGSHEEHADSRLLRTGIPSCSLVLVERDREIGPGMLVGSTVIDLTAGEGWLSIGYPDGALLFAPPGWCAR